MTAERIDLSRIVNVYLIAMLQFLFGRNLIPPFTSQAEEGKRISTFIFCDNTIH